MKFLYKYWKRQSPFFKGVLSISLTLFIIFSALLLVAFVSIRKDIKLIKPEATPFFEDAKGRYLAEGDSKAPPRGYWLLKEEIPDKIAQSFIAIEDHRFFNHWGVDPIALGRSLFNYLTSRRLEGGSTITMQVARIQKPGQRRLWKKFCEILTALGINWKYPTTDILRHYLTIVPQGNRIHGVAYSARRYFKKPVEDLGWCEAAILAAVAKAPGRMNLFRVSGFKKALKRAEIVLLRLYQTGKLTGKELKNYKKELYQVPAPQKEVRPFHSYHLINRLIKAQRAGGKKNFRRPCRSTVDIDIQNRLSEIASEAMTKYRPYGVGNIGIIVVDTQTYGVKGYIGSEYYFDDNYCGSINYANTPRASGSTLKPFIYALGLMDKEFLPSSVLGDMPFFITHAGGQYLVKNYDSLFMGPMVYRKALANSRNTPAVKIVRKIGIERFHRFLVNNRIESSNNPPSHYGLGMAIGGVSVTLENLVQGYGIFLNRGKTCKLNWFMESPEKTENEEELISPDICQLINLFLSDPASRLPAFKRMGNLEYPFAVAVKTGTSQGHRDAWCIGWSKKYITGVWMGHPDSFRMNRIGGLKAAGIAKKIILNLHKKDSGKPYNRTFTPPANYKAYEICTQSGKLKKPNCSDTIIEYFLPGTEPVDKCDIHRVVVVKKGGKTVKLPYTQFPPQYSAWASRHSLLLNRPKADNRSGRSSKLVVTKPANGSTLVIDPSTPREFQTIALEVTVWPEVKELIWIIDGKETKPVKFPYTSRWKLEKGEHTFQVKFPKAQIRSNLVKITIKE